MLLRLLCLLLSLCLIATHAQPIDYDVDPLERRVALEEMIDMIVDELNRRIPERRVLRNAAEFEPIDNPSKRDVNEKRTLHRLASMGARGFGRR